MIASHRIQPLTLDFFGLSPSLLPFIHNLAIVVSTLTGRGLQAASARQLFLHTKVPWGDGEALLPERWRAVVVGRAGLGAEAIGAQAAAAKEPRGRGGKSWHGLGGLYCRGSALVLHHRRPRHGGPQPGDVPRALAPLACWLPIKCDVDSETLVHILHTWS